MSRALQRELELAGIATSVRVSDLTRPTVLVPRHVEISNGDLLYWDCQHKKCSSGRRFLLQFADLWKKEDAEILRFASHCGVLELDADGNPITDQSTRNVLLGLPEPPRGRESLVHWRSWSRTFSALLAVSARLHQGEVGDPDEWRVLVPRYREAGVVDLSDQKFRVELLIGEFVLQSNLRPVLKWSGDTEPAIVFGFLDAGGLFAALLFHLMLAITRVDGLAICGSCQRSFTPAAKARRGTIRFCDDCRRDGSAHRVAVRNYSNRKKEILGEGEHGKKTRKR